MKAVTDAGRIVSFAVPVDVDDEEVLDRASTVALLQNEEPGFLDPHALPPHEAHAELDLSGENDPVRFRILHEPPDPREEEGWREFLTRSDWPHLCVAPEFFSACCTGQKDPFAVLAINDDTIVAVLTGWREGNSIVSGLTCRPHVAFGHGRSSLLAANALARGLLKEAEAAESVTVYAFMPMETLQRAGFRVSDLTATVVLDLRLGPEKLFTRLRPNRRRNIRQATRHGVEVFEASSEADLAAYYEVYRRWRHTSRKEIYVPLPPFPAFAKEQMGNDNLRLFLARYAGEVIAGLTVHFLRGGILENESSASLDEYLHVRPNDALIWETIKWGCAEGFPLYSMSGDHPFFLRMGGTVVPVYRHRLDRDPKRGVPADDGLVP